MPTITNKAMEANAGDKDRWVVESLGRGSGAFEGRITRSGSRSFYFRYTKPDRRQVRIKIADYDPDERTGLSVRSARQVANQWSGLCAGDPKRGIPAISDLREHFLQLEREKEELARQQLAMAARQRIEAEEAQRQAELEQQRRLTIRQLFERWAAVALQPNIGVDGKRRGRKDAGEYTRQQFERHVFPHIGEAHAADIGRGDLMAILDRQKSSGKLRTANVLLSELKQMFRFAVQREIVERNPLDGIEKSDVGGKETERERVLTPEEIRLLAGQLPIAKMNRRSEIAVWIILSTACRIGELMGARWEDLDLEQTKWLIPASRTKNQRQHLVHLSAFALSHLRELVTLRELTEDGQPSPWLFPDRMGTKPVCVKSFGKQLADRQRLSPDDRLSRRTQHVDALTLPGGHWTAHDLRRTAATLMASLGVSADVIDECLNHMIASRVTRTYIRDRREAEQARAFDALGATLAELSVRTF